jgi:two-component system, cell cycle response regulator DivK
MFTIPKVFLDWTILIVDDEEDNLDVVARLLKKAGAQIVTALDGGQALNLASTTTPHFVLSDLSMPIMDGWLFLQALKDDARIAHIPVIALTAHAMPGDRERVMKVGFKGYISKPIQVLSFVDEVRNIVAAIPDLAEQLTQE